MFGFLRESVRMRFYRLRAKWIPARLIPYLVSDYFVLLRELLKFKKCIFFSIGLATTIAVFKYQISFTLMSIYIIGFVTTTFVMYRTFHKLTGAICKCTNTMKGKVVMVTGANTGIGFQTAKELARRGARVILVCQSREKGRAACQTIILETKNRNVVSKCLDLTSLTSVREFAEHTLREEPYLHVLVNNAGTARLGNTLTADNLPQHAQVNHFGPFLLTQLLLPLLRKSAPSRIITVSCELHHIGEINVCKFAKLATVEDYCKVYANTKLANVLFTERLSRELSDSGVTANCLSPGMVATDIFRDKPFLLRLLPKLLFKSSWQGAQTSIHLAADPELTRVTGRYFENCKQALPSETAQNQQLADALWLLSNNVTKHPR